MKRPVLSLCDKTCRMVLPWAEAGHPCYCVDVQHPRGCTPGPHPNITLVGEDVKLLGALPAMLTPLAAVFAFPPCTHFAVSGARWFKAKGMDAVIDALQVVNACRKICEASGAPYMIENPVGTLKTYWRNPDYYFDPCDYGGYLPDGGDRYTKKTCLWAGGGFVMPEKRRLDPVEGSRMHLLPPSEDRGDLRSETPVGFSVAIHQANGDV